MKVAGLAVCAAATRRHKLTDEQVPLSLSTSASHCCWIRAPSAYIAASARISALLPLRLLVIGLGGILILPFPVAREPLFGLLGEFYVCHTYLDLMFRAIVPFSINIKSGKTVNQTPNAPSTPGRTDRTDSADKRRQRENLPLRPIRRYISLCLMQMCRQGLRPVRHYTLRAYTYSSRSGSRFNRMDN